MAIGIVEQLIYTFLFIYGSIVGFAGGVVGAIPMLLLFVMVVLLFMAVIAEVYSKITQRVSPTIRFLKRLGARSTGREKQMRDNSAKKSPRTI